MRPKREAFDRVRNQVGYCGIWCGSCAVGNGSLTEMARGLRELLTAYGTPQWASVETGWEPFLESLGSLKQTVSCAGCRHGGGRDSCEIRLCAQRRGLEQCVSCPAFGSCEHTKILDHMRSGAAKVGLSVLSQGENPDAKLEAWTQRLTARWPCCILFADSD